MRFWRNPRWRISHHRPILRSAKETGLDVPYQLGSIVMALMLLKLRRSQELKKKFRQNRVEVGLHMRHPCSKR